MVYEREYLMSLPLNILRGLDIKEKSEEELVQEVVNERLQNEPHLDPNRIILSSDKTDDLTPEKERELQAMLDGEKKEDVIEVPEMTEITIEPEVQSPLVESEPEVQVIEPVAVAVKAPFCQFCDSKGVRHKRECTRLQINNQPNEQTILG